MSNELSLFPEERDVSQEHQAIVPLATRLRPKSLTEFAGHGHVVGDQGLLTQTFKKGELRSSFLLWGPPGSGKTTLAHLIARVCSQKVHHLSAVTAGLKELRDVVGTAEHQGGAHLLFIDEIHRFNKSQQDALLPVLERGTLQLLGATTENPYFELRKALLSRCRVIRLEKLSHTNIVTILRRALSHPKGFKDMSVQIDEACLTLLAQCANGDARSALNLLELAITRGEYSPSGGITITEEHLPEILNDQNLAYHKQSDKRYDLISAFIKSIRASEPDAALYWLASMLAAGEDPKFILRRLLIAASEDIGLADPSAIAVVNSCANAFDWVGLPEGRYHLSQATLYLATAPKSDSTKALFLAESHLKRHGPQEVPLHLRDGSYRGAEEHKIGVGYENPHRKASKTSAMYLPQKINEGSFYAPGNHGYERAIRKRLGYKSE